MSSAGQIIGGIAGATIGFFMGNPIMGAQLGIMAGGLIDPPKGPKLEGPRLSDLSVQLTGYGNPIPRIYGTTAVMGTIFWVENNALKETATTTSQGGKGGPSQEVTTYSYSATFALGLCQGPIEGVKRVWISGKLVYDAGSSDALISPTYDPPNGVFGEVFDSWIIMLRTAAGHIFTLYNGTDTQDADPRMQAALGVANTPAYRGLAYLVFEDLPLADYGNSLMGAQIKVEVMASSTWTQGPETLLQVATQPGTISDASKFALAPYVVPSAELLLDGKMRVVNATGQTYAGYQIDWTYSGYVTGTIDFDLLVVNIPNGSGNLSVMDIRDSFYNRVISFYVTPDTGSGIGIGSDLYQGIGGDVGPWPITKNSHIAFSVSNGTARIFVNGAVVHTFSLGSWNGSGNWKYVDLIAGSTASPSEIYISAFRVLRGENKYPAAFDPATDEYANYPYPIDVKTAVGNSAILSDIVSAECLASNLLTAGDLDASALTDTVRGYKVANTAAIRSAINPLQAAFPFDALQSGYGIKFVPRGQASVATIDISELGAVSGSDKQAIRITNSREMDLQLPRRVELTHLDVAREYDTGEQAAERLNTDAINILRMELPIVMTPDEAAQTAEVLLYLYWLERHDISFVLPPAYVHLQPADVVTINGDAATYQVRLTSLNLLPDGRLECSGKYNDAAVYSSSAVGESGLVTGQTVAYSWANLGIPLDIPCVGGDDTNQTGLLWAASGGDNWRGSTLYYSTDSGSTWKAGETFTRPGATYALAKTAPTAKRFDLIDASQLKVKVIYGALYSATLDAMLAGANHLAWGADGRWEIIGYQTVTDNGDGTLTLGGLLRGRFGTELNASLHAVDDAVVLLSKSDLKFQALGYSSIRSAMLYRMVGKDLLLDSASNIAHTYAGINLKPLSPVYLTGWRNASTNDFYLSWMRRPRLNGEWKDGVDAAVGESAESYDIEFHANSTYSSPVRTVLGVSAQEYIYSSAQQTADFGSTQTQLYVSIYQNSPIVGRGARLNRPVPFSDGGLILMKCDGVVGGTTFTDEYGKTITNSGAIITSDTIAPVSGPTSAKFDANGYLIWPAGLPNMTDFCLEWYWRGDAFMCLWCINSSNYFYNGTLFLNGTSWNLSGVLPISTTTWYSYAFERLNNVLTLYVNGVSVWSTTYSAAVNLSSLNWGRYVPNNNLYATGYLDLARLSNRAVYGANYTPPTNYDISTGEW